MAKKEKKKKISTKIITSTNATNARNSTATADFTNLKK
jgi:hypothetical protein